MSVVGVVDGQSTSGSPGLSKQPAEKKKKEDKKAKSVKSTSHRPALSVKIEVLDQKWLDRFNRLEALLLAKTMDRPQEPTFSAVKVTPTHAPPANVIRTEPFLKPSDQPSQQLDRHSTAALLTTDSAKPSAATKTGSVSSQSSNWPGTSEVIDQCTV